MNYTIYLDLPNYVKFCSLIKTLQHFYNVTWVVKRKEVSFENFLSCEDVKFFITLGRNLQKLNIEFYD